MAKISRATSRSRSAINLTGESDMTHLPSGNRFMQAHVSHFDHLLLLKLRLTKFNERRFTRRPAWSLGLVSIWRCRRRSATAMPHCRFKPNHGNAQAIAHGDGEIRLGRHFAKGGVILNQIHQRLPFGLVEMKLVT